MAVFTSVSDDRVRALLQSYDLGDFVALRGIATGIENSNFFLTTTRGEYVLTIFEVLTAAQLPFYIELMHHLAQRDVPVPHPQTRLDGSRLSTLAHKPTAIVSRLAGAYEPAPTVEHCALAGQTLARTHLATKNFAMTQPNLRGLAWWEQTAPVVLPYLPSSLAALLTQSLDEQRAVALTEPYKTLPFGPSHCDLFRDNVLFAGTHQQPKMGGFIDFYFAGCDTWLFDVAVSVNDWCIHLDTGSFKPAHVQAWLAAYTSIRPFTAAERLLWPTLLRAAALRFWISRLYDFYLPRAAQTLKPHDPSHFERVLQQRTVGLIPDLPKED